MPDPETPWPADHIFLNGNVVTVDDQFSVAEAIAIRGERIVAVGTSADVRRTAGPDTSVTDLGGRTVLPGFIDTHAHAIHRGQASVAQLSLHGADSVAEIARRIAAAAAEREPGAWVLTSAIGEHPDYFHLPEGLAEGRWPTRHDLDAVAPDNPVCISTEPKWPHPAVFNTAALALLEVTRDWVDDARVKVDRDAATGEPTGLIYGLSMHNKRHPLYVRLQSLLPKAATTDKHEGILRGLAQNLRVGVTSIYEGHGNFSIPELEELRAGGRLINRVSSAYEIPTAQSIADIETWMKGLDDATGAGSGDRFHRVIGVTVSTDGPSQWGLALMSEPYLDYYGQESTGATAVSAADLVAIARLAAQHDLRLNIQAAGDLACEFAVRAMREVDREFPIAERRWVLQHFQHPTQEHIAALAELNAVVQTYSSVDFSKGAEVYVKRMRGNLWESVVPLRWWIDGGVPVAGSSDGGHYDPMFQIWESLVRVDGRTGESLQAPPKEISREEAIRVYTINGAKVIAWEDAVGSIEVGKYADFVVLDHDILTCPIEDIPRTRALSTVFDGKVAFEVESLIAAGVPRLDVA